MGYFCKYLKEYGILGSILGIWGYNAFGIIGIFAIFFFIIFVKGEVDFGDLDLILKVTSTL